MERVRPVASVAGLRAPGVGDQLAHRLGQPGTSHQLHRDEKGVDDTVDAVGSRPERSREDHRRQVAAEHQGELGGQMKGRAVGGLTCKVGHWRPFIPLTTRGTLPGRRAGYG